MTNTQREFYEKNYDTIAHWVLRPGKKVVLGDPKNPKCRFCGRTKSDATFNNDAHAIPELLGNRSIISAWECDACNQYFGNSIDNDLGNWSKPLRTFSRIKGKNGVPTLTQGSSGRIRYSATAGFQIRDYEFNPSTDFDEVSGTITFRLTCDTYTPVAVLKSFTKMGLALMPEEEIHHFQHALAWVRYPDHAKIFAEYLPLLYSFQPGPMPNDRINAWILRRKPGLSGMFYAFFILLCGNELFQVILPSKQMDTASLSLTCYFPIPAGLADPAYGPAFTREYHLEGTGKIKGRIVNMTCFSDRVGDLVRAHQEAD